jgi:hypothetical protein
MTFNETWVVIRPECESRDVEKDGDPRAKVIIPIGYSDDTIPLPHSPLSSLKSLYIPVSH